MVKEFACNKMEMYMKEIGMKIKGKVMVLILGKMVINILVNGKIIKGKDKDNFIGLMVNFMKASGKMIKETVMALKFGKMGIDMTDSGKIIKNMVKDNMNGIMVTFI